jgi:hypothetical protein
VTLRRSEQLFAVEGDGFALITKRIDQVFPDYERLIQPEAANIVTNQPCQAARIPLAILQQWPTRRPRRMWSACAGTRMGLHLGRLTAVRIRLPRMSEGEAETAVQICYLGDLVGALRGDSVRLSAGGPGSMIYIDDPADDDFFRGTDAGEAAMSDLLAAALDYAARGLAVFSLRAARQDTGDRAGFP